MSLAPNSGNQRLSIREPFRKAPYKDVIPFPEVLQKAKNSGCTKLKHYWADKIIEIETKYCDPSSLYYDESECTLEEYEERVMEEEGEVSSDDDGNTRYET